MVAASFDRFALEREFIADLRPIFSREFTRARQSPLAIPYGEFQTELAGVMADNLYQAARPAGAALIVGNSLVVSLAAFDSSIRQWASSYGAELARQVVDTSRTLAGSAISQITATASVLGSSSPQQQQVKIDLALAGVFMADQRLANIAITEVTRGISQGENAVVLFFGDAQRVGLVPIWQTAEDARVCQICRPFDGTSDIVWGREFPNGPPAHGRCRCWRRWVRRNEWARRRRAA